MGDDSSLSEREKRLKEFESSQGIQQRKFHTIRNNTNLDDDHDVDEDPGIYQEEPAVTRFNPKDFHLKFNKATDNEEENNEQPKLSTVDIHKISNTMRTGRNNFKNGKKYGIGAQIMQKWGYIEGQGLGKDGQGIMEPIEQKGSKFGSGIGADSNLSYEEEDESSDEEYYRNVPKKSLFQIIVELEEKGVQVPDYIKKISDENIKESNRPFIKLQKSGNIDFENIRTKLDNYNKELDDVLAEQKVNEFEEYELEQKILGVNQQSKLYSELLNIFQNWDSLIQSESYHELRLAISQFKYERYSMILEIDIQKYIILAITPRVIFLLESWDPLDLEDTTIIDELINWKESLPKFPEIYGELNYFQSLICSKWYPKIANVFNSTWKIDQPNIAITILLDWMDIIDPRVIDVFVFNIIGPRIIDAIRDWNPGVPVENPPYLWIFEWKPYLKEKYGEVVLEFMAKYKHWFENWDPENGKEKIEGLHSFIEIVGHDKFNDLIDKSLLPQICNWLMNLEIDFIQGSTKSFDIVLQWREFFDLDEFERLMNFGFGNTWLKSLYHSLSKTKHLSEISKSLQTWFNVLNSNKFTGFYVKGLDMINQFIDTGELIPYHESFKKSKLVELIKNESSRASTNPQGIPEHRLQITFKEVVERYCDEHGLFLSPLKENLSSRHLLFKLSRDPQGRSGKVCYIEEDVLFVKQKETFEPISIDSLDVLL